ncbi:MAG: rhodanese-like domain-containing protein [Chromatiaceae bacterium]
MSRIWPGSPASPANTSKHLQQLKAAGLVQARRDGKHIRYMLGDERVLDALAVLRAIAAAHISAVEDLVASYLKGRDALEPVPAQELLDRVRDGLVTLLDVRPPEEYDQAHVAGALNVPLEQLRERLGELPRDRGWWLIAGAPGVSCPSRPWRSCVRQGLPPGASRTACPSGAGPGCRWSVSTGLR